MEQKRKKLGGTPMSTLKGQESTVVSQVGKKSGDRAGFLTVDKGWNKFRFFPAHPGTESFMYANVCYFLPQDVKDEDGKIERKNKKVFNSKVHGGTEKDLIEEYIKFLTSETLSHLQGSSLEEALKPIQFNGKYNLQPKIEWVSYANKYNKEGKKIGFGRVSVTPGTKNKMEKLIATEGSDEPIVVDPFTDEEDGIAVILTYDPDAKDKKGNKDAKNFYNVELEQQRISKFRIEYVPTPLDEKEIEEFLKIETLESMYKNCYKLKDFNLALSGLEILDRELKFDVLKDSRFLEIVEEIKAYYPEESEEEGEVEKEAVVEKEGDELDSLDREALKKLIVKEFGQGVIVIRKNYSDDEIREMIRAKREEMEESPEEEETLPETDEEESSEPDKDSDLPWDKDNKAQESQDSLKAMREKMQQRKNASK